MEEFLQSKEELVKKFNSELIKVARFMDELKPSVDKVNDKLPLNEVGGASCSEDPKILIANFNKNLREMIDIAKNIATSAEERTNNYKKLAAELKLEADILQKNVSELESKFGINPTDAAASSEVNVQQDVAIKNEVGIDEPAPKIETEAQYPANEEMDKPNETAETPVKEAAPKTPPCYEEKLFDTIATPETPKLTSNMEEVQKLLGAMANANNTESKLTTPVKPPNPIQNQGFQTPEIFMGRAQGTKGLFGITETKTPETPEYTSNFAEYLKNLK